MEKLPLLLSFGCFLIWAITALFLTGRFSTIARSLGLGISLIQLASAIWASVRVFGDTGGVIWRGVWFSVSTTQIFEINLAADIITCIFWITISIIVTLFAYFRLLHALKNDSMQARGEAVATPLIAAGALLSLCSTNFVALYMGWGMSLFAGFLATGFSTPQREDRAKAATRYLALSLIPEILFSAGLLGCYAILGSLEFSEINAKAADAPVWIVYCLVAGAILRGLQIPLMQSVRHIAASKVAGLPVFFIGHLAFAPLLFQKIYPLVTAAPDVGYFALIPALSAISAAVLALAEKDPALIIGWIVSYICSSVLLSGIAGDYQSSQALAVTGLVSAIFLAKTLNEVEVGEPGSRWLMGVAALVLCGIPGSSWGWARYLEYLGLVHVDTSGSPLQWVLVGIKVLADIIMGFVIWGLARERWQKKGGQNAKIRWEVIIPTTLIGLATVAIATGGRTFSGVAGSFSFDFFPSLVWFERLVTTPTAAKSGVSALELIGGESDIMARVLLVCVLLLPLLISLLWLFRDIKAVEEFRSACRRTLSKVAHIHGNESLLWDWVIKPIGMKIGAAAQFIDGKILDRLFGDLWTKPANAVRKSFVYIEEQVLDSKVIDGVAVVVGALGKQARKVQNGQVQFYFALGLILMGAVVIRFVVVGG